MTSARKSKLSAVAVFSLTALVVLGGMTWATLSTIELAKYNITQENDTRIHRASWQLDSYVGGILYSEAARDYTDYVGFHAREPIAVLSDEGWETNPYYVMLPSPILKAGPLQEWIDLYFQLDHGELTSPQLPEERWRWALDVVARDVSSEGRARRTWDWFDKFASETTLREHMVRAQKRENSLLNSGGAAELSRVVTVAQRASRAVVSGGSKRGGAFESRKRSLRDPQSKHLPLPICETQVIAERNIQNIPRPGDVRGSDSGGATTEVEISLGAFAPPFWLDAPPGEGRKLVFVRECTADSAQFHQGFIGDWASLKVELLKQIEGVFPSSIADRVDLVPVTEDAAVDAADASELRLSQLPVVLDVPYSAEETAFAAWRSVSGVLAAAWAAALVVLGVAGWGVRNLVSLTERRMQFAYAVTHELRTPLTTFRLYSDMLSSGLVPEDAKQLYLDTLNQESERLTNLVESVLEYARLENQKVRLNPIPTDGAALLAMIATTLEKRCLDCGIKPLTRNDLPAGTTLRTDVEVVNQIAGVLINNACRHARGRPDALILVHLTGSTDQMFLDVIDSGPGIHRSDARAIFKPFRRGKNADSTAQGGIGLGLALARNWAGLLHGHLDLVARHHRQYGGAHFRLTCPAMANA